MDHMLNLLLIAFTVWCGAIFISTLAAVPMPAAAAGAFFTLMALKQ
jgi:hypothetical protein